MSEPHRLGLRVYYEDTDFSGVVYHANYLRFLERGRTELLRDLGVTQANLRGPDGTPLAFAVHRMEIDFRKPARMDDRLVVETAVTAMTGATLRIAQAIRRDEEVLTRAHVIVVLVANGRPRRLPSDLTRRFEAASLPCVGRPGAESAG